MSPSVTSTFLTPSSLAAASAAALVPCPPPATSTCTSPPNCAAAVSALLVESFRTSLSCSAISNVVISEHPGFGLEFGDELGDILDLDAGLTTRRLRSLEDLEARREIDTGIGGGLLRDRLLLCLHDVGQRSIARLVEAKIGGDDRGSLQLNGLQAAIDLAGHLEVGAFDLELGGKGRLCPTQQRGQHLAGLVAVVVDRLLAQDDQAGLLLLGNAFEDLGHRQGFHDALGLDQDAAIGPHGERSSDGFGGLRGPDRDHD